VFFFFFGDINWNFIYKFTIFKKILYISYGHTKKESQLKEEILF